jgi:hypothetical protein
VVSAIDDRAVAFYHHFGRHELGGDLLERFADRLARYGSNNRSRHVASVSSDTWLVAPVGGTQFAAPRRLSARVPATG